MALLILVLALVFLLVGVASVVVFVVDVIRWHPREQKEIIVPSNSESAVESEVIKNDGTDNDGTSEPDEHNTSAFSAPWCQS